MSKILETNLEIQGTAGCLEAIVTHPTDRREDYFAIVCHPHSMHGGSMKNKVVTTLVRTFNDLSISSIRFNFRSVGNSEGEFDNGPGEGKDLLTIVQWIQENYGEVKIILAGFSFGSYVAYSMSSQIKNLSQLILVAPPVHHYDYTSLPLPKISWSIVQGDQDEVVPPKAVFDWIKTLSPSPHVFHFPETGHFFHGKLISLREKLSAYLSENLYDA